VPEHHVKRYDACDRSVTVSEFSKKISASSSGAWHQQSQQDWPTPLWWRLSLQHAGCIRGCDEVTHARWVFHNL